MTTVQLYSAIHDAEKLTTFKSHSGPAFLVDYYSADYDGIFPRCSDWTRLVNKIERDGAPAFLTWICGGFREVNKLDGFTIHRDGGPWDDEARITFAEPITMQFDNFGLITEALVTEMIGRFSYDWAGTDAVDLIFLPSKITTK